MPSVMQRVGTPNPRHNLDNEYRKYLDNVDPELSQYNEVIRRKSVEEIYSEHLQPAFEKFNAKQKRKDRRLDVKYGVNTYLDYQRALDKLAQSSGNKIDQKGRPPIREIVWQFGNPEQGFGCKDQTDEQRELAKTMLLEAQAEAELRYPQLKWGDLSFHADEVSEDAEEQEHGSLHLHASFVPICLNNKQGPEVQVAFERCLQEMGFSSFQAWKHDLDNIMEEVLKKHGLERIVMDNHEKHMESSEFHRQQRLIRETKALEAEIEQLQQDRNLAEQELTTTKETYELETARLSADKTEAERLAQEAVDEAERARQEAAEAQEATNKLKEQFSKQQQQFESNKQLIDSQTDTLTELEEQIGALNAALPPLDELKEVNPRSTLGGGVKLTTEDYELLRSFAEKSAAALKEAEWMSAYFGDLKADNQRLQEERDRFEQQLKEFKSVDRYIDQATVKEGQNLELMLRKKLYEAEHKMQQLSWMLRSAFKFLSGFEDGLREVDRWKKYYEGIIGREFLSETEFIRYYFKELDKIEQEFKREAEKEQTLF